MTRVYLPSSTGLPGSNIAVVSSPSPTPRRPWPLSPTLPPSILLLDSSPRLLFASADAALAAVDAVALPDDFESRIGSHSGEWISILLCHCGLLPSSIISLLVITPKLIRSASACSHVRRRRLRRATHSVIPAPPISNLPSASTSLKAQRGFAFIDTSPASSSTSANGFPRRLRKTANLGPERVRVPRIPSIRLLLVRNSPIDHPFLSLFDRKSAFLLINSLPCVVFERSCGSCGYALNLSSADRYMTNIGAKYRKSIKKGIVSFVSVDESRFSQVEEFHCRPYFESWQSWGLMRRRTKLFCRNCRNFVGVGQEDGVSSPVGSDSSSSGSGNGEAAWKKYDIKIKALQPLSSDN
ncbi:hypothetical protein ZIOFF_054445 [Zingiber officinale]|uniref:Uncharacterized protein n=1 Tax=Zingiber officinale TaxID=94328 RepID=A0A8J5FK29_ZINOF|nr:hypothetical protein ZIOFF_054445 [Zingiber officinale]